jgi:hypothetical protein
VKTLLVALALFACKNPAARKVSPPTTQEAEAFAKDFAGKLSPCDTAAIDRLSDVDLMLSRAVAGRSRLDMKEFKRGMGSLGTMLCRQFSADVNITYLRVQQQDGAPRPLIRLVSDKGVNYFQLELDKHAGQIKLADLYIFVSGEKLSETLGSLIDAMSNSNTGAASKLIEVRQRMRDGKWQEAHAEITTLPRELRDSKQVRLLEVLIAAELSDDVYVKTMNTYAKMFPNDPSLSLVMIDNAILRKQYDAALKYMTELDTRVGGDPYLDVLRAGTLSSAGRTDEALAAAKRATEREATLQPTWWQLLTIQCANQRYADALPTLEALRDKFQVDVSADNLNNDERFVGLVASPEYKAWAKP